MLHSGHIQFTVYPLRKGPMTSQDPLFLALQNMVGCFGDGPDSDDFWESWIDCTACDCRNPDHIHSSQQVREYVLREARAALANASVSL